MIRAVQPSYLTKKINFLPKGLFYQNNINYYTLADARTGEFIGRMKASATTYDPNNLYKKKNNDLIFHIFSFEITQEKQDKHWGTYLMNFAKGESYRQNCEGRISLVAYNKDSSPHPFYWKQGFKSKNEETNEFLKRLTEGEKTPYFLDATAMYLPEKSKIKSAKQSFWFKTWKQFKKIFGFHK